MSRAAAPSVVSIRVSPNEHRLLQAAAAHARTNLSDFMRRTALEAAEIEMLNVPLVQIPADDWERFESWAFAPARDVPALRELAATRPAWQD